ncbi:MAG: response regulator [Rhodothalassiaceae bacterium]
MSALRGKRILVVEDEPIVAMSLEGILEDLEAVVVGPVGTVAQALRLAADEGYDAALLDININGERSYPVAELVKNRNIPLVFASGYGDSGWDGAPEAPVIGKPYNRDQLARALGGVLGAGNGR